MREIKFRAWDKENGEYLFWETLKQPFAGWTRGVQTSFLYLALAGKKSQYSLEQYTGLRDRNGVEIYEGDVFRIEVEHDHGDERDYAIVTYVKEWGMFATLLTGERFAYLDQGVSALDEVMFWTFTLEDACNDRVIGNIHQNPELLKDA